MTDELANALEAHGEALHAFSAIMLKKKLFPEKGNALTDAYEAVVLSWAKMTEAATSTIPTPASGIGEGDE